MKFFSRAFLLSFLIVMFFQAPAYATTTILPTGESTQAMTAKECSEAIDIFEGLSLSGDENLEQSFTKKVVVSDGDVGNFLLSCAIKSGKVKFWMVKYLVRNVLQFLIALSGLISILMIMIGAYYYMAGGLTDDKEKGKKVITYAIGGLILTTISWFLVNVLLLAITG